MKTSTPQRTMHAGSARAASRPNPSAREQLSLRSLPDCLLAAYDEVSHRAFERFVARGSNPGNEISDWRAAEKDLFLPVDVDFEDTPDVLYALAVVEQGGGTRIEVAIEDRWLLIWAHLSEQGGGEERVTLPVDSAARGLNLKWIEWEELQSVLQSSEDSGESFADAGGQPVEDPPWDTARPVTARPFCVAELPVEVDISRSSAVLADGLIAIRMPKIKAAAPEPVETGT